MKSLLVTAVVLSSFATQGFAEQPDLKSKESPLTAREQQPSSTAKRPEIKAQPVAQMRQAQVKTSPPARTSPAVTVPSAPVRPSPLAPPKPSFVAQPKPLPVASPAKSLPVVRNEPAKPGPLVKTTPAPGPNPKAQVPSQVAVRRPAPPTILQATGKPGQQPGKAQVPSQNAVNTARPQVQQRQVPPVVAPAGRGPLITQRGSITPQQLHEVQARNEAFARQNPRVQNFVDVRGQAYRNTYHQQLVGLQTRYLAPAFLAPLRVQYRPWVSVGFYAYAYPVRPVVEFYTYFSNPCVAWFYNDYDAEFYQPFYGQYYTRFPDLNRGYNHVGIYLPTEEFIAMNVALSEMRIEAQINYRRAMSYLGDRLAERYRAPINRHQVIVNHYVMLPSGRGVIVEGFVDNEHNQMPFRALVDLHNADESQLFAVGSWRAEDVPTAEQSEDLYDLNDQVVDYGGTLDEPPPAS